MAGRLYLHQYGNAPSCSIGISNFLALIHLKPTHTILIFINYFTNICLRFGFKKKQILPVICNDFNLNFKNKAMPHAADNFFPAMAVPMSDTYHLPIFLSLYLIRNRMGIVFSLYAIYRMKILK